MQPQKGDRSIRFRAKNSIFAQFENLTKTNNSQIVINTTCAVFAETEIVSLLATGTSINDILAGLKKLWQEESLTLPEIFIWTMKYI